MTSLKHWIGSGAPWVWLSGGAVSLCLVMVLGLLLLIAANGLGHFWPADLAEVRYREDDGGVSTFLAELVDRQEKSGAAAGSAPIERLVKIGNREINGLDFRWLNELQIQAIGYPDDAVAIEREEWGDFYGYVTGLKENGKAVHGTGEAFGELIARLARKQRLQEEIRGIETDEIGAINYAIERLRLRERRLELEGTRDLASVAEIAAERRSLEQDYAALNERLAGLRTEIHRDSLTVRLADGTTRDLPLTQTVRVYRPNRMGLGAKLVHYATKAVEFLSEDPREANSEGGIFPAIFGTVLMVLIMTVLVTPLGIVAAIYLREYARQGPLNRFIRIAVNNLAGVPSVVYGVFGLGFFVYFVGGSIDRLFYPEALPAPTFGTPGLLWCSLTLALLTLPVVIVTTEEGLMRIPSAFREGSLALGATKLETLWRVVLPMASPAIITGLILAVARAAGEVAPLMMVGVVKLAPSLAMDGNFPFLHLDRKIMHLGFHIYDVGFQSPNVEAARPLVYATALLLVLVVVAMNLTAIRIRNRLREKYRATEN